MSALINYVLHIQFFILLKVHNNLKQNFQIIYKISTTKLYGNTFQLRLVTKYKQFKRTLYQEQFVYRFTV